MCEINHVVTEGYKSEGSIRRDGVVRVECPECGAGGGSSYPCICHECDKPVLMLPLKYGVLSNWNEVFKPCNS